MFGGGGDKKKKTTTTPPPDQQISGLSPLANSVVARCSKILGVPSPRVLQQQFEADFSSTIHTYAKHLIEYCSFKAFHLLTHRPDYLSTKDFRRFTYDVMLAWEDASQEEEEDNNKKIMTVDHEEEEEDGWSLFYTNSINMALQVDQEKTVGPEAFARIAPACPVVADIITVRNLFDVLTASSDGRLHFVVYDKFLGTLDKVIKTAKFASGAPLCSTLQLSEGEIVLNVDGTVPTQPVLQHIGISAWPGRLTLTNYALYFESGVGLYDKPVRYDLAMELKQVVKPELTGPLGARLFDKAVMYRSTQLAEPVYFEFPEFKGSSRRDYWLDITLEVLRAHKFIRKYNFKDSQKREAVAKAILGIFRLRAVREAFHIFPSGYKTLLDYNLAEKLPRGDMILETLSSRIQLLSRRTPNYGAVGIPSDDTKQLPLLSPASLLALKKLGFLSETVDDADEETEMPIGDVSVGETNPIELAIKQSQCDTSRAETAQATVDQVKIEGLDTNIAVMKDLLFPVVESVKRLHVLASWEDPFKSTVFLVLVCYTIYRDWMRYAIPCMLLFLVMLILWRRQQSGKQQHLEIFKVTSPPTMNPVEQLLALQEALSHLETFLQAGNISLLKVRALVFSALPQATDMVIVGLLVMAAIFVIVPLKAIVALAALEMYTREMPLRKDCSDRWARRLREWWIRIPAAPVVLIKKT